MHYHLTGPDDQVIDSSKGKDPLHYLQGHSNIIPGLEKEMEGKAVGDKFVVNVSPEEGYGVKVEELVQKVEKTMFPADTPIEIGMQFQASGNQGPVVVTVIAADEAHVTIDGNHALAGIPLTFEVEVMSIRAASEEEVAHGHVHGPGGHQH